MANFLYLESGVTEIVTRRTSLGRLRQGAAFRKVRKERGLRSNSIAEEDLAMQRRLATGSNARAFMVGLLLLGAFAVAGCQPPPGGNAAAPAAPPGAPPAPPPPPGAPPSPMGVEASAPATATPLDAAWSELIAIHEEQLGKLAAVQNEAQAEAAVIAAVEYRKKLHAVLTKIAGLGGSKPPGGVPAKLRAQYKAAEDKLLARDEVVSQMISPAKREQLGQHLQQVLASNPELAQDPFALSAETRTAGSENIATVTLVNNKSLQGPAHQQMIARLQQLAGASKAEPLIEADGTYKVILSPVADFASFIRGINFGDVSNRSDAFRTFTLTIDPERFQATAGAGGAAAQPTPSP
jgi:hypothetical protein